MSFETDITPTLLKDEGDKKSFEIAITRNWFIIVGPNGGFIAAALLRAMTEGVADHARLARTLTIDYFSPPPVGSCQITTQIIRQGKSLTSIRAEMSCEGKLNASATASFAKSYPSAKSLPSEAAPQAQPFEKSPLMPALLPIHTNYEMRAAFDTMPGAGGDKAVSGGWTRLIAPPENFNAEMIAAISDCWPPALFSVMTPSDLNQGRGMPTIELSIYFIQPEIYPTLKTDEPVLAQFRAAESINGFFTEDGDIWTADGRLLARVRQLAITL